MTGRVSLGLVAMMLAGLILQGCSPRFQPPPVFEKAPQHLGGVDLTAPTGYGRLFVTKPVFPLGSANIAINNVEIGPIASGEYFVFILPAGDYAITAAWTLNPFDQRYQQPLRILDGQDEFLTVRGRVVRRTATTLLWQIAEALEDPSYPEFAYVDFGHIEGKTLVAPLTDQAVLRQKLGVVN